MGHAAPKETPPTAMTENPSSVPVPIKREVTNERCMPCYQPRGGASASGTGRNAPFATPKRYLEMPKNVYRTPSTDRKPTMASSAGAEMSQKSNRKRVDSAGSASLLRGRHPVIDQEHVATPKRIKMEPTGTKSRSRGKTGSRSTAAYTPRRMENEGPDNRGGVGHVCDYNCPRVLREYRPGATDAFHVVGSIPVKTDVYNRALGSKNGLPIQDTQENAKKFCRKLSMLLWTHHDFREHNVGGVGQGMNAICETRLGNLMQEVRKRFPLGYVDVPSKSYEWVPKVFAETLNRHFRSQRSNKAQGEAQIFFFACFCLQYGSLVSFFSVASVCVEFFAAWLEFLSLFLPFV